MSVWEVTFSPADNRFYYISRDEFGVPLAPYKDTDVSLSCSFCASLINAC